MEKDYSLLRPFDLEAAKRGEEFWAETVGGYLISSLGRVRGPKGIMAPNETRKGYLRVCMSVDGTHVQARVHRLVASAFIDNPDNLPHVNHINGDKKDNNVVNLEWCNNQQNMIHMRRVLKVGIVPLVASNDNETILFESWAAAREAGHNNGEISRIINNPLRKHHGFNWYNKEVFDSNNKVLAWVEGKPVYRGDVLYWNDKSSEVGAKFTALGILYDGHIAGSSVTSVATWGEDGLSGMFPEYLTWQKPKTKREGWVNVYRDSTAAYIHSNKKEADENSDKYRVACIRIEWEE